MREGLALHSRGELEAAATRFETAVQAQPNNSLAHYRLGYVLDDLGRSEDALIHLRRSVELDPGNAAARRVLGYVLLNAGYVEESMEHSRAAVDADAFDGAAHINLGYGYYRLGSFEKAYFHLQKAVALTRDNAGQTARAQLYSGILLYRMRRIEEAEERFRLALAAAPENPEIHYRLGLLLDTEAKTEARRREGLGYIRQALRIDADYLPAHRALAYIYVRDLEWKLARAHAETTLARDPNDTATRYNLGLVYYRLEDFNAAEQQFNRVLKAEPENFDALFYLASIDLRYEKYERAARRYEAVVAKDAGNRYAHYNLGLAYAGLGDTQRARAAFERACKLKDDEACKILKTE